MGAPTVANSTKDERLAYVRKVHPCTSNCDVCGFCASYGRREPQEVFAPYIGGQMEYAEAAMWARRMTGMPRS